MCSGVEQEKRIKNRKKRCDIAGFSLIEAAIALVIIGVLIPPIIMVYEIERKKVAAQYTQGNFSEITDSINYFVGRDKHYPLPASMLAAPADAEFGVAFASAGAIGACPAGMASDGICRTGGPKSVLIGAVPFDTLGINPDFAFDYWDNKILYAVTEDQTNPALYPGTGGIGMLAYESATSYTPVLLGTGADNDMVLLSHGDTAMGAYDRFGNNLVPCAGPAVEEENCNLDATFFARLNNSVDPPAGTASDVPGATFYDDYIQVQHSVPKEHWLQNDMDSTYALTLAAQIGVGTQEPEVYLHVKGNVRADDLDADSICDGPGSACFDPKIIAGNEPEMDCGQNSLTGNEAVLTVRNGEVQCASPIDSSNNPIDGEVFFFSAAHFTFVDCGATAERMIGISGGVPQCAP